MTEKPIREIKELYVIRYPNMWMASEHFEAKMMEKGYIRISILDSRYLFCYPEDLDELISLLQYVKEKLRDLKI